MHLKNFSYRDTGDHGFSFTDLNTGRGGAVCPVGGLGGQSGGNHRAVKF